MRKFSFSVHPVLKLPWELFLLLCFAGMVWGVIIHDREVILPCIVGILIFSVFFSIRRFSFIVLGDRSLKIKLGFIAECELPISSIESVSIVEHKAISGIGVRACGGGETAIVTRTGEVVRIQLRNKGSLKLFKVFKITYNLLRLSPEKQGEFIESLKTYIGTYKS